MSTPSPLQPQGTLDRANAPRSRVRITVLTILALHVVFIGGLLLQGGCNKSNSPSTASTTPTNSLNTLPGLADPGTNSFYTSFPGDTAAAPTNSGVPALGVAAPANPAPVPGVGATVPAAHTTDPAATGGLAAQPNGTAGFASPNFPAATTPAATAAPTGAATEHTIKSGDTVRDLAKKYGVSEKAILEANPTLNPRKMKIDAKISIPAPSATAAAAPASRGTTVATEAPATGGGEQYVVKPGDTLAKIAKKFGVTVKQIIAANSLKNDRIVPKQKLTIPAKASTPAAAPAAAPAHSTTAPTTF